MSFKGDSHQSVLLCWNCQWHSHRLDTISGPIPEDSAGNDLGFDVRKFLKSSWARKNTLPGGKWHEVPKETRWTSLQVRLAGRELLTCKLIQFIWSICLLLSGKLWSLLPNDHQKHISSRPCKKLHENPWTSSVLFYQSLDLLVEHVGLGVHFAFLGVDGP